MKFLHEMTEKERHHFIDGVRQKRENYIPPISKREKRKLMLKIRPIWSKFPHWLRQILIENYENNCTSR